MTTVWDQADFVGIPLLSGGYGLGQIVAVRDCLPDSLFLALSLRRLPSPSDGQGPGSPAIDRLALSEVISILFVAPSALAEGLWPIFGFDTLPQTDRLLSLEQARRQAGRLEDPARAVHDPALVEAFVNACHGLLPWDYFPDPALFDGMLLTPANRPAAAVLSGPAT